MESRIVFISNNYKYFLKKPHTQIKLTYIKIKNINISCMYLVQKWFHSKTIGEVLVIILKYNKDNIMGIIHNIENKKNFC